MGGLCMCIFPPSLNLKNGLGCMSGSACYGQALAIRKLEVKMATQQILLRAYNVLQALEIQR